MNSISNSYVPMVSEYYRRVAVDLTDEFILGVSESVRTRDLSDKYSDILISLIRNPKV